MPIEGETRLVAVRGDRVPWAAVLTGAGAGAVEAIALDWAPGGGTAPCPCRMATPVPARPPMKTVVTAAAIRIRVASFMAVMVGGSDQPQLRHP